MSEDSMAFPNTWEEFEKEYGFTDTEEIYTNGSRLIQSFRVKQWLEHLDAEPVIRCKDCRWYEFDRKMHCGLSHGVRSKDDYCSDAERSERR